MPGSSSRRASGTSSQGRGAPPSSAARDASAGTAGQGLAGKVALVTGSTGEGMGRQTAWTLARDGARVVVNYGTYRRSRSAAERVVRDIERLGSEGLAVQADTRIEADVRRLVRSARKAFGGLDIVVGNAGGDFIERPLGKLGLADWKRVVEAELDGAFLLARETLPDLRRSAARVGRRKASGVVSGNQAATVAGGGGASNGAGRLVFISWDNAERAREPLDYAVGKLARDALARKLALAEQDNGVTVNTVAPGYMPYPTRAQAWEALLGGTAWSRRARSTGQDVAECVAWLCSDEARFVTGSWIRVHGPWKPG